MNDFHGIRRGELILRGEGSDEVKNLHDSETPPAVVVEERGQG